MQGNQEIPRKARNWLEPWKLNGSMVSRWRKFTENSIPDGEEIWHKIQQEINNNPNAKKEVWIVVGRSLSKKTLLKELNKTGNKKAELVQLAFLVNSTWGYLTQCGVQLKVFCSQ